MKKSRLNAFLSAVRATRAAVDDETAANIPNLFQEWRVGESYSAGDRITKNGVLYSVLQNHTSQEDWIPADSPSLFAQILPGQSGTEIGEWSQPDSTNPYMTGDRVTYNGVIYESLIDNNIWSPEQYPAGWQQIN